MTFVSIWNITKTMKRAESNLSPDARTSGSGEDIKRWINGVEYNVVNGML